MKLSKINKSTIIEVRADFGFSDFECDPEELTNKIGITPDEIYRKGNEIKLKSGRKRSIISNGWYISSHSKSKDINVHLRYLLKKLQNIKLPFPKKFGTPFFNILWKGNYLYAGSGPFYETDVLQGIATLKAELWQDIYQIDAEES